MELDISKIVAIPSEEEVTKGLAPTKRALCGNFTQNKVIIPNIEALLATFTKPSVVKCDSDLFKNTDYKTINNIDELKKKLSELLIKFDTDPRNLTKADYGYLVGILYLTLLYLYSQRTDSVITTEWADPLRDNYVPSEKLAKESIDKVLLEVLTKQELIPDLEIIRQGAALGATALQSFTEIDPTVPDWAKANTKPTYTASEVGALPSSTVIPDHTSLLVNDSGYITSKDIPVIDKTSDPATSFAIDSNKMYMFGTRNNLTIITNTGESGVVNEYMFQFTSGNTATTLNVPSSVVWLKDPNIQSGKKYLVSIENNLGIIGEWDNE